MKKCLSVLILWTLSLIYVGALNGHGYSQESAATRSPEAVSATVCEIVKNGAAFNGKHVSVRAFVVGGIPHGIVLVDDDCSGGLTMDAAESVREHEDYVAFMRAVVEQGGKFTQKSETRIVSDFFGLLEYHPKGHQKWVLNVERISGLEVKRNVSKSGNH